MQKKEGEDYMESYDLHDRILGSLITAGIGDAFGAPAEAFSREEIREAFGRITKFEDPSSNIISPDNHVGEITDDSSQLVEMAKAMIKAKGKLTTKDAADALVAWSENWPKYYPRNAGETTRHIIKGLKNGEDPLKLAREGRIWGRGCTNGAVMRVAAAGLIHPGNWDGAVDSAVVMTSPSHGTQHAYAAACAAACAVAEAVTEHADVWSIIRAALYGARRGHEIGLRDTREALGPDVLERTVTAVTAALMADNMEELETALDKLMGDETFAAQGAAAVALAMFAGAEGDSMKAIYSCANFGGDTDTLGCIAGMIAGALNGCKGIPEDIYEKFRQSNPQLNYEELAEGLYEIACTQ